MKLILASKSPRRFELLGKLGIPFEVVESHFDETTTNAQTPYELVKLISQNKAAIVSKLNPDCVVLAADTACLLHKDIILGKPSSPELALNMLMSQANQTEEVITGFTIMGPDIYKSEVVSSTVTFKNFSEKVAKEYIAREEPYDKAGAYGIQDLSIHNLVASHSGSFYNIMGLPLETIAPLLEKYLGN